MGLGSDEEELGHGFTVRGEDFDILAEGHEEGLRVRDVHDEENDEEVGHIEGGARDGLGELREARGELQVAEELEPHQDGREGHDVGDLVDGPGGVVEVGNPNPNPDPNPNPNPYPNPNPNPNPNPYPNPDPDPNPTRTKMCLKQS